MLRRCKVFTENFGRESQKLVRICLSFSELCVEAGNVEACYTLPMIHFYCLENRGSGASLFAKAAISPHPPAWYMLADIQFNDRRLSKVHGAFAGFSGITVGICNTHYVYLPTNRLPLTPSFIDGNQSVQRLRGKFSYFWNSF
ncbi:hypothetical protein K1719_002671 [Acacia pycnantha]|nr:hypothetical protein K1719_002671 [Acacia pycnantha]